MHLAYDYASAGFRLHRDNDAYRMFVNRAITEILTRSQPGDFLLCTFGLDHQPVAVALPGLITVESGIGYDDASPASGCSNPTPGCTTITAVRTGG